MAGTHAGASLCCETNSRALRQKLPRRNWKRTIANFSTWPAQKVEMLRRLHRGDTLVAAAEGFQIPRSLPHGHVAAVLGTVGKLGLDPMLFSTTHEQKPLVLSMIVRRIIDPVSKLAMARGFGQQTASSSLWGRFWGSKRRTSRGCTGRWTVC